MARRRKRLNKRIIVLLIILGVLIAVGATAFVVIRSPRDPSLYVRRGEEALKAGNYKEALKAYSTAYNIDASPKYNYRMAGILWRWANDPNLQLTDTEAREHVGGALQQLRRALRSDSGYTDARRFLCDVMWALITDNQWRERRIGASYEEFVENAQKLLEDVPDDHQMQYRCGVILTRLAHTLGGDYVQETERHLTKATKLKPDEAKYWLTLAGYLRSRDKIDRAKATYREALEVNPSDPTLHVQYSAFLLGQDQDEEALNHIRQAIEASPEQADGYIALARYYQDRDHLDYSRALKALNAAQKIEPGEFAIYLNLGEIYKKQDKPERAEEAYRRGIEAIEERLSPEKELIPQQRENLQQGRTRLRFEVANALLNKLPDEGPQRDELLSQARNYKKLIEENAPNSPRVKQLAGRIAFIEGDYDRAMNLLEEANRSFTGIESSTVNILYNIYLRRDLPGKAEHLLDRLLSIRGNERNPTLLMLKAKLAIQVRDYEKAADNLRKVLASDSDFPQARNLQLAVSVIRQGRTTLPADLELTPLTTQVLARYATSMWEDGRRQESLKLLENLYTANRDNLPVAVRLVEMSMSAGQPEKARDVLEEAIARHPDNQSLQNLRDQVSESDPQKRFSLMMMQAEQIKDPLERNLKKADISRLAGKEQDFLKYTRAAEEIKPDSAGVIRRMFQYALGQKDWKLAEKYSDKAAQANLDGINGAYFRARLAESRGEYEKAIEILAGVLEDRPSFKDASALLGGCYLETRQLDEAENIFKALAEDDPGYLPALIGMAKVTELRGKWSEHTEWIRRAYRQSGGKKNRYVRGRYLATAETGSTEEIIAKRQRIRQSDPDDIMNLLQLAGLYEQTKQDKKAEQLYETVAGKVSNPVVGYGPLVRFYNREGRISDAEKVITELIETAQEKGDESSLVGMYVLWGNVLSGVRPDQAENAFQKAIEIGGSDTRGLKAMVNFLSSRQRWSDAAEYLEQYLRLSPKDRSARKQLINLYIQAGNYSLAENKLNGILESYPGDVQAKMLQAVLVVNRGEHGQARKILTDIIDQNPDYPAAYMQRAALYRSQGEWQNALSDLKKARVISPDIGIAMDLAATYRTLGRYEDAVQVYRDVYAENQRYVPVINALIDLYLNRKEWRRAQAVLTEAQNKFPDNVGFLLAEARMWNLRDRPQDGVSALARAIKMAPDSRRVFNVYVTTLIEAGGDNLSRAVELCNKYRRRKGFEVFAEMYRGLALAKQDDIAAADSAFAEAVKISPPGVITIVANNMTEAYGLSGAIQRLTQWSSQRDDWASNIVLARLHQRDDNLEKAIEYGRNALELAEDDNQKALAMHALASIYQIQEQYPKAEKVYLDVLKLRPEHTQTLNNLAYMYADQINKPKKALQYAQKAYIINPASPNVLDTYGWTLAILKKYDEAEKYLTRSIRLENSLAESRYHLGWVYEKTNRMNQAMKLYRQAYELARREEDKKLMNRVQNAMQRVESRSGSTTGSSQ